MTKDSYRHGSGGGEEQGGGPRKLTRLRRGGAGGGGEEEGGGAEGSDSDGGDKEEGSGSDSDGEEGSDSDGKEGSDSDGKEDRDSDGSGGGEEEGGGARNLTRLRRGGAAKKPTGGKINCSMLYIKIQFKHYVGPKKGGGGEDDDDEQQGGGRRGGRKKVKPSAVQFKKKPKVMTAQVSDFIRRTSKFGTLADEYVLYEECFDNHCPGFTPSPGQAKLTKDQFNALHPHAVGAGNAHF